MGRSPPLLERRGERTTSGKSNSRLFQVRAVVSHRNSKLQRLLLRQDFLRSPCPFCCDNFCFDCLARPGSRNESLKYQHAMSMITSAGGTSPSPATSAAMARQKLQPGAPIVKPAFSYTSTNPSSLRRLTITTLPGVTRLGGS